MDGSNLDTRNVLRGTRLIGGKALSVIVLSVTIGLSACGGGSSNKSISTSAQSTGPSGQTATQAATDPPGQALSTAAQTSTSSATGTTSGATNGKSSTTVTTPAATASTAASKTTHSGKRATGAKKGPTHTKTPSSGAPSTTPSSGTVTTIAANSAAPAYSGPSPLGCLEAAGLNRARPGIEQGAWEANSGLSSQDDTNTVVVVSGPYKDDTEASQYARSLTSVELSASADRWVVSASLPSHLQAAVNAVAACLAGSGAS